MGGEAISSNKSHTLKTKNRSVCTFIYKISFLRVACIGAGKGSSLPPLPRVMGLPNGESPNHAPTSTELRTICNFMSKKGRKTWDCAERRQERKHTADESEESCTSHLPEFVLRFVGHVVRANCFRSSSLGVDTGAVNFKGVPIPLQPLCASLSNNCAFLVTADRL